jgi:microcystin-dependent protein
MAINFPNSPTNGQIFTSGSTSWIYDGVKWGLNTNVAVSNDSMPVGSILWFANTSTTPPGWLAADGSAVSRTTYATLFASIGTTYGSGDGSTTFNVPSVAATTGKYFIRYTTSLGTVTTTSLSTAPVGTMLDWPTTSSYPTGYLRADGSAVSRTSYADLFALIGTTYGVGDNSTTFNLPNLVAAGSGSPVKIIKASLGGTVEPSTVAHASSHTQGGSDVITVTGNQIADYQTNRNVITNGAMRVAQYGTSFSYASGGGTRYYPADRFNIENYVWSAGSNPTISNDTTVYPSGGFRNSIKYQVGATGLTFSSGGWQSIMHRVEGYNIAHLYSSTVTLSFWVRSSVTGTYGVTFANDWWGTGSPTRMYIAEYTINAANTWEKKTITTSLATATASGTWNSTNGLGLLVEWGLGSNADRRGSTYTSGWTNFSAYNVQSNNQTQLASTANATFYLAGVQLEAGSTATPFEFEPYETTLRKCQRYYQKTDYFQGIAGNAGNLVVVVPAFFEMRTTITPTIAGTTWDISDNYVADHTAASPTMPNIYAAGSRNVRLNLGGFTGLTSGRYYNSRPSTTSLVGLSAEL